MPEGRYGGAGGGVDLGDVLGRRAVHGRERPADVGVGAVGAAKGDRVDDAVDVWVPDGDVAAVVERLLDAAGQLFCGRDIGAFERRTGSHRPDLHERRRRLFGGQLAQRLAIAIPREQHGANRGEDAFQRESIIHRRCLIPGVQHAVGALCIAGFIAVLLPGGGIQQSLKRVGVAILEEIAGLLPTENAVSRHTPRRALQVAFPHEELQEQRRHVELPAWVAVGEDFAEHRLISLASGEVPLVGRLVVGVARRDHHAFHAGGHHLAEKGAHRLALDAFVYGGIGGHAEARLDRLANRFERDLVPAFLTYRQIVMFLAAIHVNRKGEVLAGLEKVQLLGEQQSVGAQVDVLLARYQTTHDLVDARVHERFPARNGHRGHAALFHRAEALFGRQLALEDMTGILDLSAAGARQVAAIEGLQHEHQRVALAPLELLLQDVTGDGPHLRRGNGHISYNTRGKEANVNRIRVSARTMTPSGSRRAPLQARSNKTVEEILDAASWLLGRVPFEEITTSRIAGQAGISVGALYRFYSDRQEIFDRIRSEERRVGKECR